MIGLTFETPLASLNVTFKSGVFIDPAYRPENLFVSLLVRKLILDRPVGGILLHAGMNLKRSSVGKIL